MLRFYLVGFPNIKFILNEWVIVPKRNDTCHFTRFFHPSPRDEVTERLENYLISRTTPLTHSQRSAEWFTLRAFHISATMAGKLFSSTEEYDDATVLDMLLNSWFSRSRSTTEMVIGTKNEDAILKSFSTLQCVARVFECGLFECKDHPWLAASPDGLALFDLPASPSM